MRRRFLGERFLLTILILLICVNVGINVGFAETEGKYRVELVLPTTGSVYPNERLTAQITTFLDKYKPPEPGQPPPPLSPEDWVYIGNVTVRFEVKDEAGNTVDLNIPQGLKTDDKGWLQISFNAPSREGKYTVTAYAVIEGVECSDSEPILVSKEERPSVPTPTPTPQPTKTLVFEAQHLYIAVVIILSVGVVLAVVLAIRRRRKFLVASIAVLAIAVVLAYGVQFATPPTSVPTPTPEFTTVSPYLAEFRRHPELFVFYTKVLYVLVKDESGRTVANLTCVFQAIRINYTVRATLNCSLEAAADVANVSFGTAVCWLITEGATPVPMPLPIDDLHTLRHGESIATEPEAAGSASRFGENWTWAQFSCMVTLNRIKVAFTDGHVFTHDELIDLLNTSGDLFEILHNNLVETEERVFVSE